MRVVLFALCVVGAVLARRHGPPPCGLPPFLSKLPAEAKAKVEAIWKDYKKGDDCDDEREETHDVIDSLPEEQRNKLLPHRGPAFLEGVSSDVRKQFTALWRDHSIPRDEKPKKFEELANRLLTGKNLEEYKKFHEKMEKMKKEREEKVKKLSPEARAAYDELQKLREAKEKIFDALSESAREELRGLWHGRWGHHHWGGHHGGPHGNF